ncbi:MAG: hypothetical protein DCC68_14140 [Planctomycetota bacterium]|nr:MAG: hypothetical protein DCC68_14140 [Planctomycetota bacterium]
MREDYHYERRGTQAIFMFVDPIRGWRRVEACDSRTRVDWAEQVRRSLEEDYPDAKRVKWVCDNSKHFPPNTRVALRGDCRWFIRHAPEVG